MTCVFMFFLFMIIYSYVVFPGGLFLLTLFVRKPEVKAVGGFRPVVSVIISAYNEEAVIEQKVRNTLDLDYPTDLLEVIVSSDGSTDRTNEIVAGIQDSRLVLKAFPERAGKTACLNRVVLIARGDVVLFSDANSMYPKDLLEKLAPNFQNPDIGSVTGWTKYKDPGGGKEKSGLYAWIEKNTKVWESSISSCVGADGAVFAMRKSLYRPLQEDDINDFVIPLDVIRQGKRVILDPAVYCVEESSKGMRNEYNRQVRITTRTLNAIQKNREFLNPLRYGIFSFFLFSHKVCRFLVPFFLIGAFLTNLLLLSDSPFYALTLSALVLVPVAAHMAGRIGLRSRILDVANLFFVTAFAHLVGWCRMALGAKDTTWTPQR